MTFILSLFLVLFIAGFTLLFPSVQNYVLKKTTNYLSSELGTEVVIGEIFFDPVRQLLLKEILIRDKQRDTLLYASRMYVGFNKNIFQLFQNKLSINNLELDNSFVNIQRTNRQQGFNFQFLVDYFSSTDTTRQKQDFNIDMKKLRLTNTHFKMTDKAAGQLMEVFIPFGQVNANQIDLKNNYLDLRNIIVNRPTIKLEKRNPFQPLKEGNEDLDESNQTIPSKPLEIKTDYFVLKNAAFQFDNWKRTPVKTIDQAYLDYDHLSLSEITFDAECINSIGLNFNGKINQLSAKSSNGFELEELFAEEAKITSTRTEFNQMYLKTNNSILGDTLVFKYTDYTAFDDFNERVLMDARFKESRVLVDDIIVFAHKLSKNAFFNQIKGKYIDIDGRILGKVNSLRAEDLKVNLGDLVSVKGNFSTKNLAVPNEELFNLGFDDLKTSMANLRRLLPNFNPPSNFDKLGTIRFKGRYDGFISDFVAYGDLATDVGSINLDMQLNTNEGKQKAKYRGKMIFKNFNIAKWSDNDKFGKMNWEVEVNDGRGLTLESVHCKLKAMINDLHYNQYHYKNLTFKGELNKNLINGDATIKDDNVDVVFSGLIDMEKSIPTYKFTTKIGKMDLLKLNLSKDTLSVAGDFKFDFKYKNLSNFTGTASANNIVLKVNRFNQFSLNEVYLNSYVNQTEHKHIELKSEMFHFNIDGKFEFESLPWLTYNYLERNHPQLLSKTKWKKPQFAFFDNNFQAKLNIEKSKNLFEILKLNIADVKDILAVIKFQNKDSTFLDFELQEFSMPYLVVNNKRFEGLNITGRVNTDTSQIAAHIESITIGKDIINEGSLSLGLYKDTIFSNIGINHFDSLFKQIRLNSKTFVLEDDFMTIFNKSGFSLLDSIWRLEDNNFVRYNRDKIYTRNFEFRNSNRKLSINSLGDRGLALFIQDLPLTDFNPYLNRDRWKINGITNVTVSVQDIFKMSGLEARINTDSLMINNINCGNLRIYGSSPDLEHPIDLHLLMKSDESVIKADGFYQYPTSQKQEDLQLKAFSQKAPLAVIMKFIIKGGISEVEGFVDADLSLKGKFEKLALEGEATLHKGGVKINYLQTKYYFNEQKIKITPFIFDFDNTKFTDRDGNLAVIHGGILHDHFKQFKLDLNILSDKLLLLDTKKKDNALYYGSVYGNAKVVFSGDFANTNIEITGISKKGTSIVLPLSNTDAIKELNFIRFVKNDTTTNSTGEFKKIEGLDVEMNLTIHDDSEINIVFDEITDDIIKAKGNGNLVLKIPRKGAFTITGQYDIESGEYNYTVPIPNFSLVKQPFFLRKGSTISWTGDPYEAIINMAAESKNIRTSIYPFIEEYLINNPNLETQAKSLTSVDLLLNISGQLFKPDINFKIEFPGLQTNLKNFVDTKLLTLANDPNELNKQALSLLITRSFLPSNSLDFNLDRTAINTLSNLVSFYLSKMLSQYITSQKESNNFISGIDINVGLAYNDVITSNTSFNFARNGEISFNPKFRLFEDKVVLDLGANIRRNAADQGSNYFATDLGIEYYLKPNRELVLRIFVQGDRYLNSRLTRTGGGITFRKEYESFYHFLKGIPSSSIAQ